ncbi:MAG: efflux RND transporter permease subunit [Myxococcota bacterium]
MAGVRGKIEDGFGSWSHVVVRHRWVALILVLAATAGLATRVPLMEVETSTDDYLRDGDPEKIAYNAFRDQFGRDQVIFVVVEPPDVFDLDFLAWLRDLHEALEDEVPYVDDVSSLVKVRSIYAEGDTLVVDDLLQTWPEDQATVEAIRSRALATESYLGNVLSADGSVTALQVRSYAYSASEAEGDELGGFDDTPPDVVRENLSAREHAAYSRAVIETVDRFRRDDYTIHMTGQPLVAYGLTRSMAQDVPRIFGGALLLVGVMIVALFRRLSPLLLSATVVILSLVSTLGVVQLLGFPISIPTQILPSFMLAVGVGYVVHLLTIFFRALGRLGDRGAALEHALRHVGLPILMTAATTIAGLVSFLAADLETAYQLGISGAIGVTVVAIYTLVFVPAMLSILPLSAKRNRGGLSGGSAFLEACARLAIRHPKKLCAGAAVLALGSIALLPRLDHSANPMDYFPDGHWLKEGTFFTDERLGGMQSLEVVIDTQRPEGLHEVAVLDGFERLDALVAELRDEGEKVTRTWSMLQILKETNQALNQGDPAHYVVPRDERLVAQELLLFEQSGSDDLEKIVDRQFSQARVSLLTGWEDGVEKQRFIDRVRDRIVAAVGPEADVTITGAVALIARTASASSETMLQIYSLALLLITPMMIVLIGSLRAGLVSMVPNLVPILASLALMVVVGIELDLFTILGACIAIGLAVDDSIHFISGFRRHFEQTGDAARAVELTMASTGRALLFTSVVLAAGFATLGLSSMANLGYLGLTTAFAISLAFVLDVTVTPALLVLTHRKVGSRKRIARPPRLDAFGEDESGGSSPAGS